jgi:thioredoxin reductase
MVHLTDLAVAIVGAGPFGLSVAAHLRSDGVDFRIFGSPMHRWLAQMPRGMFLKSEGCASNLFEPAGEYTLKRYCAERGVPYAGYGTPVSLETFAQYGLAFQRRLVPTVENVMVARLERRSDAFELQLANGESLKASKVVVATGMSHTAYVPPALARLPGEVLSHSCAHHDFSAFKGRDVTVIGGGQSALETAALLHEAGCGVRLVVRRPSVAWAGAPSLARRSLRERMRRPMSNLGPGLGPWLYSNAPMLFHHLPRGMRIARVRKALGPAGAWWLKDRVAGRLPIVLGHCVHSAETQGDRVRLYLGGQDGGLRELTTDHVIAATGYRFALRSLPLLSERLLSQVRSLQDTPILSRNYESSVPGLYFTGLASANQFGPAMRFLHGAYFTAQCISRHIVEGRHPFPLPFLSEFNRAATCEEF